MEAELARDYAARATATGRSLGLGPVEIVEVEARKPGKAAEAEVLRAAIGDGYLICCDEHGDALPADGPEPEGELVVGAGRGVAHAGTSCHCRVSELVSTAASTRCTCRPSANVGVGSVPSAIAVTRSTTWWVNPCS